MKKHFIIFFFMIIIASCGHYGFYTRSNPHLKTIMITEFQNETEEYELPELITEYLTEKIIDDNRLEVKGTNADTDVIGAVNSYQKTVFSYDEAENPLQWQVAISFAIDVEDMIKDTTVWKNSNLRLKAIYGNSSDPDASTEDEVNLQSEDEAIKNIIMELGANILSNTIEQW